MAPIVTAMLSLISLLILTADRVQLLEQSETLGDDPVPLPLADDGLARNYVDVLRRMVPGRALASSVASSSLRAPLPALRPRRSPRTLSGVDDNDSLLLDVVLRPLRHALHKRDVRDQLWGKLAPRGRAGPATKSPMPSARPAPSRANSLGELRDDLMVHGRDRQQLKRRWKIEDANKRVANFHG